MNKPKFLPTIEEYLESVGDNAPVDASGLDELVYKIRSYTGLSKDTCAIVVSATFQEIRNQVSKGKTISFKNLGSFSTTKKTASPKFKSSKSLKIKLHDKQR